jgi:uncharacterized delta-60 repeat protein/uncharacterized protein (TIGR03000 family)
MSLGPDNDGVAEAVALQPNGEIVVAGYAGAAGSQTIALARYNPDGSLDTSFGNGGTVVTPFEASAMARAVAVAPDGTIIVAGSVQPSAAFTTTDFMVARYNANGSLDTAFGSGGLVDTSLGDFDAAANALVVEPDGTIVAAGHTSTSSGFFNFALVRYTDVSFNGYNVSSIGIRRSYVTPNLETGKSLRYEIKASWLRGDQRTNRRAVIETRAGKISTVDFRREVARPSDEVRCSFAKTGARRSGPAT